MPVGDYSELDEFRGDLQEPSESVSSTSPFIRKSIIDAAGDLIVGTADDTPARLAAGDEDDVLTIDGGVPAWKPGGGGSSALSVGNSLFVDVDGNDGTGTRERFDKPYLTIVAANAAKTSGDTIFVRPGTYNERNVVSGTAGLDLGQAVIQYTGTTSGIIDDSAAGTNADLAVKISGRLGSLKMTGNPPTNRGIIQTNRAGSLVTFDVDRIEHTGTNTNCFGVWSVLGEINGRAQQINTLDGIPIYWQGGNGNITVDAVNHSPTGAIAVINTAIAGAVTNANSKWHVNCPVVISTQFALRFGSSNSTSRFWFTGQRVYGGESALLVAGAGASVVYVTAQKLESSTTTATYAAIHIGESIDDLVQLHVTVQKVEGGANDGSFGNIYMLAGRAWIMVLDELKDTGLTATACVNIDGGEMDLSIGNLTRAVNYHAIDVRAGTLRLTDSYINTAAHAGKSALRGGDAAVVTLRNVHLQVHPAADSIASIDATTFTVICEGTCTSNRDVGANVTIVGNFVVNSSFT